METQSNEPTDPMEQAAPSNESQAPEPGKRPLSDEMRKTIQELLKTQVGDGLCKRLSALARLDLHKGQMNVTWIDDLHCLDVRTPCHDLSPLLYESLRAYTWNHNMAIRFDDMISQLHIVVRWFRPALDQVETGFDAGHEPPQPDPGSDDPEPPKTTLNVVK